MSKQKKKQKGSAEKVYKHKNKPSKVNNPFEVKINKQKHKVVGQKSKNDKGFPGISRNKAFKKRKAVLQMELKKDRVSNVFLDKRLGEKDEDLDEDDKRLARYAAQKEKSYSKNIYNLDDTEELTHLGRSLEEIEKYDDPRSDDEDEGGALQSSYVQDVHFGGFLTKKQNSAEEDKKPKSKKEWLEFMISQSKMRKAEKMKDKDETLSLTEKVDTQWKDTLALMSGLTKTPEDTQEKPNRQSYDKLIKELIFQPRAKPTDALLSEKEQVAKEKERLEKLEKERIQRMKGIDTKTEMSKSADELGSEMAEQSDEETQDSEVEEPDDNEDEEPDYTDSEESSEDAESETELAKTDNQTSVAIDEKEAAATKDHQISSTQEVPSNFSEFLDIFSHESGERHEVMLDRIIKCNHPSLNQDNKAKLDKLFSYLLKYIKHIGLLKFNDSEDEDLLNILNAVTCYIYQLLHLLKETAIKAFKKALNKSIKEFRDVEGRKRTFPKPDTLLLLSLIPLLFPTSDFQHPICTPAALFIITILHTCRPKTRRHVCIVLFLLTLLHQWVSLSKRYIPEAMVCLEGLLHTAVPRKRDEARPVLPPFRAIGTGTDILTVNTYIRSKEREALKILGIGIESDMDNSFRLSAIDKVLDLLRKFIELYKEYPASRAGFIRFESVLERLPKKKYPEWLKDSIAETKSLLRNLPNPSYTYLRRGKERPKALRLYEPKFEMQFDGRKHWSNMGEKKRERKRLQHQYKRELKGAIREVRKDSQVLQDIKQKEQRQKDEERKRKVKALMASLGEQEGDYKAIVKKKKK